VLALLTGASFVFWGDLWADGLGLLLIGGTGVFWVRACSKRAAGTRRQQTRRRIQIVIASLASGAVFLFAVGKTVLHARPLLYPSALLPAPTAIFVESQFVGLPVMIPAQSSLNVVPANKRRMRTEKWGFFRPFNGDNAPKQWPDHRTIEAAKAKHDAALFAVRYDVSNAGDRTIVTVAIPLDINFGNEKPAIRYHAIIAPLNAGQTFSFYVVNDCPESVSLIWQEETTAQVLGEESRRPIRLRRKYRSPIDQIAMLFPATTQLVGAGPCE
jgi:hypothetical protein